VEKKERKEGVCQISNTPFEGLAWGITNKTGVKMSLKDWVDPLTAHSQMTLVSLLSF
jgi:hypothetical protein